jgi:hypothetical protein
MKKCSFILILFLSFKAYSQTYNNEWIDYNKTYYKFKVGKTGLYRITQNALNSIGLASTQAQHFQLWRNGKEISLFTSISTGIFSATDYIEFLGVQNDGEADKSLYRDASYQLSDAISLQTDTASYFLTINQTSTNNRFVNTVNNVAGNSLAPTTFFIHTIRNNFRNIINRGFAQVAGSEYLYSSSYDIGEMWSSTEIRPGATNDNITSFTDLQYASSGPAASFKASMAGTAPNARTYKIQINNTDVLTANLSFFSAAIEENNSVPLSILSSNSATVKIINQSTNINDRIVCGFFELKYPRLFNFSNQSNFEFTLPASAVGHFLEISNFNNNSIAPVLYDVTNNKRFVGDIATSGVIKFAIPATSSSSNYILVSQAVSNIQNIQNIQTKNFTNYSLASNHADYIIISNSILFNGTGGVNPVEQYRLYRNSTEGGNYNSKIFEIEELQDQFAFGIKKHPNSIRNFLRFARANFNQQPKYCLLIGKGVNYMEYRYNENNIHADKLNLVPTFGFPASDILLSSNNHEPIAATNIGRIGAITAQEVLDYLNKVKQFELAQKSATQTIDNKAWMKNVVHVAGSNDANIEVRLINYLRGYENINKDTLFGGKITNFNKQSTGPVTPIINNLMNQLFEQGISLLTYYGHSSASSLDYNLDDPSQYNNTGKYPVFLVNGCNAGNFFSFDTSRFVTYATLSEKYTLANQKGCIAFIASTHFGLENYLDYYSTGFYKSIANSGYNKSISLNIIEAVNYLRSFTSTADFYARMHEEQTLLHGDPALKLNAHTQPDFVVEDASVKINPVFISVAENKFNIKSYFYNIGKATGDSISIVIRRQYPSGVIDTLVSKNIKSVRFIDSLEMDIPIVPTRDIGENKLYVTIDSKNVYNELSESNNSIIKSFFIIEDDIRPIYPYNYAIINKQNIKLSTSTANPVGVLKNYIFEIDTTEKFNSPIKVTKTAASSGGIIEWDAGITFTDSTSYYWRVAPVPTSGLPRWNTSSFVYINNNEFGFNQSHYFQHQKSIFEKIYLDSSSRIWKYKNRSSNIFIQHSIFPTSGTEDIHFSVSINGASMIRSACLGRSIIFNVLDPVSLKPLYNQATPSTIQSGTLGNFMGSANYCASGREFNFEFSFMDAVGRKQSRDFMNWVPDGFIVIARLILDAPYDQNPFVDVWKTDEAIHGVGNSLYSKLKQAGFAELDSFNRARTWAFVYKKNDITSLAPSWKLSQGLFDRILMNTDVQSPDTTGFITSPIFGPAKVWNHLKWRGAKLETTIGDNVSIEIIGIKSNGQEDVLQTVNITQQDVNLSSINSGVYPYLKLKMKNEDAVSLTPYQLRYWRVYYTPVPEGALATNLQYSFKDSLEIGEPLNFSIAFKNVSEFSFSDSLKVNLVVYDRNNVANVIPFSKRKKLNASDTTIISVPIQTNNFSGSNTLLVDVNPGFDQPEQFRNNNFLYKNFVVKPDSYNPLLDVTFDGVHILNNDIISSKPNILIKLKDESKFLALDDTSLATIFIKEPNNTVRRYKYGTDTLKFIPANLSSGNNEALIQFNPSLLQDGDYELTVRGKDKSGNNSGTNEYKVVFKVINKPMITNLFNYPNPFTTSTAFVFTLTGSQIPQNIKIQILTVTGKIVREITKDELGPIHIGRNITDYKWDGTDQYGQKLANGVYLYRVSTNLNGTSLEKYTTTDSFGDKINTDKYFKSGYGKMYLMH